MLTTFSSLNIGIGGRSILRLCQETILSLQKSIMSQNKIMEIKKHGDVLFVSKYVVLYHQQDSYGHYPTLMNKNKFNDVVLLNRVQKVSE